MERQPGLSHRKGLHMYLKKRKSNTTPCRESGKSIDVDMNDVVCSQLSFLFALILT